MAQETVTQIEDGILNALYPLHIHGGGKIKTLQSYQGSLEDALEHPERISMRFPAVLIVYAGGKYTERPTHIYSVRVEYRIIAACESLRTEKDGRRGAYQLLDDIREKLAGYDLGLKIAALGLVSEDPVLVGKVGNRFLTIYSATYATEVDYSDSTVT